MLEFERAKVLVAGDSDVGKTAFVHLMCHQQPLLRPAYTIGCSLDVKIHQFQGDTNPGRPVFIELWDIGGCNAHANTRSVFYQGIHGLILVYDCTNNKSQANLRKWLWEILPKSPSGSLESVHQTSSTGVDRITNLLSNWSTGDVVSGLRFRSSEKRTEVGFKRSSDSAATSVPVLVVGTKTDLLGPSERRHIDRRSYIASSDCPTSRYASIEKPGVDLLSTTWTRTTTKDSVRHSGSEAVCIQMDGVSTLSSFTPGQMRGFGAEKTVNFASEFGFPEIVLSCQSIASLAPNCWNAMLLDKFLDDVVRTKLYKNAGYSGGLQESPKSQKYSGGSGSVVLSCWPSSTENPHERLL